MRMFYTPIMTQNKNKNCDKNNFFVQPVRVQKVPDFRGKSILFAGRENLTSHLCGGVVWGMGLTKCDKRVMMLLCGKRVKTRAIGVS